MKVLFWILLLNVKENKNVGFIHQMEKLAKNVLLDSNLILLPWTVTNCLKIVDKPIMLEFVKIVPALLNWSHKTFLLHKSTQQIFQLPSTFRLAFIQHLIVNITTFLVFVRFVKLLSYKKAINVFQWLQTARFHQTMTNQNAKYATADTN